MMTDARPGMQDESERGQICSSSQPARNLCRFVSNEISNPSSLGGGTAGPLASSLPGAEFQGGPASILESCGSVEGHARTFGPDTADGHGGRLKGRAVKSCGAVSTAGGLATPAGIKPGPRDIDAGIFFLNPLPLAAVAPAHAQRTGRWSSPSLRPSARELFDNPTTRNLRSALIGAGLFSTLTSLSFGPRSWAVGCVGVTAFALWISKPAKRRDAASPRLSNSSGTLELPSASQLSGANAALLSLTEKDACDGWEAAGIRTQERNDWMHRAHDAHATARAEALEDVRQKISIISNDWRDAGDMQKVYACDYLIGVISSGRAEK